MGSKPADGTTESRNTTTDGAAKLAEPEPTPEFQVNESAVPNQAPDEVTEKVDDQLVQRTTDSDDLEVWEI
jgi:hypothetical protein